MSFVTVAQAREWCRVVHREDDNLLQQLIDSAEDESRRFLNRTRLPTLPLDYPSSSSSEDVPSDDDPVAPSVVTAILILVQSRYEQPEPDKQASMRRNAETLLMPYRNDIGV